VILGYLCHVFDKNVDIQVRFQWTPRTSALWDNRYHMRCLVYCPAVCILPVFAGSASQVAHACVAQHHDPQCGLGFKKRISQLEIKVH
jgi:hypothetical protein